MRYFFLLVLLFPLISVSQEKTTLRLIDSLEINAESVYGIDAFNTLYFSTRNGTFHKKTKDTTVTYTNFQLGKVSTADTFNPLKLILFYRDFNTIVVLDNRLAEAYKVDFNTIRSYKNVAFTSVGYDNTVWVFNQDLQQLELYDYKIDDTRVKTVPIQSKVLDLKSDYNYCYLLTEDYLYTYNYFGSLVSKTENKGYSRIAVSKNFIALQKGEALHLQSKDSTDFKTLEDLNLLISQFFVTDESLYIYNHTWLKKYQLKTL